MCFLSVKNFMIQTFIHMYNFICHDNILRFASSYKDLDIPCISSFVRIKSMFLFLLNFVLSFHEYARDFNSLNITPAWNWSHQKKLILYTMEYVDSGRYFI